MQISYLYLYSVKVGRLLDQIIRIYWLLEYIFFKMYHFGFNSASNLQSKNKLMLKDQIECK